MSSMTDNVRVYDQLLFDLLILAKDLRTKVGNLAKITQWAEGLGKLPRAQQYEFVEHATEISRQAFLSRYGVDTLIYLDPEVPGFSLQGLGAYITNNNIELITEEFERARFELDRNVNARLIFNDMGINLARHLLRA